MNTKRIIYYTSLIAFLTLFYHQRIGLNLLIFNLIVIFLICILQRFKFKNKEVPILLFFSLITATASAWFADWFSIFMNISLLVILPVFLFDTEKHLVTASLKFAYSCLMSPVNLGKESPFWKGTFKENNLAKLGYWLLLPLLVGLLFMTLYTYINQDFAALIEQIQFPNLDIDFVWIFILGSVLMLWFWYYKTDALFTKQQHWFHNGFTLPTITWMENDKLTAPIVMKRNSGIVLFSLLNLMLVLLLVLDFGQLIIQGGIPEDKGHSEYVHEGVYAVIVSIVLAVALIMIYLRKYLNFGKINVVLQIITTVWIGLNFLLVVSSSIKNWHYINAYGLTYKRLGVYAFLLLCIIGLIFTGLKILTKKTNYYLIRNMSWTFLVFFVLITPINWSAIITKHNINVYESGNNEALHIFYLDELPIYNAHILLENQEFEESFKYKYKKKQVIKAYNKRLDWRSSALYFDWLQYKEHLADR